MIKNNKPDRALPDAIKLATQSLHVWSELNDRGMGYVITELGNHIENDDVIRKSSDPATGIARNIVKKMLLATDRVMRKTPLQEKWKKIEKAFETIRKGHVQGLCSDNDLISASMQYDKLSKARYGKIEGLLKNKNHF